MPTVMRLKEKYRVVRRMKRMGSSSSGNTQPPRHKRRTPSHNKGTHFPGMWKVNPPKEARKLV